MARINIEDRWWNDPRRRTLRLLLQRDASEQVAVNAWRTGHDYWCDRGGASLIPGNVFIHFDGYKELIQSGLAIVYRNTRLIDPVYFRTHSEHNPTHSEHNPTDIEHEATDPNTVRTGHIYLCGMRDSLLNLMFERTKKSLAGKKSAAKRLLLYGTSQPKLEQARTRGNTAELSTSSSSSVSSSLSLSLKVQPTLNESAPARAEGRTNPAWKIYEKEFIAKYKTEPVRNAKINSQLSQLLKRVPSESIPELIRFYFTLTKPIYLNTMHNIGFLLSDAEAIHAQMKGGIKLISSNNYINGSDKTEARREHNKKVFEEMLAADEPEELNS